MHPSIRSGTGGHIMHLWRTNSSSTASICATSIIVIIIVIIGYAHHVSLASKLSFHSSGRVTSILVIIIIIIGWANHEFLGSKSQTQCLWSCHFNHQYHHYHANTSWTSSQQAPVSMVEPLSYKRVMRTAEHTIMMRCWATPQGHAKESKVAVRKNHDLAKIAHNALVGTVHVRSNKIKHSPRIDNKLPWARMTEIAPTFPVCADKLKIQSGKYFLTHGGVLIYLISRISVCMDK